MVATVYRAIKRVPNTELGMPIGKPQPISLVSTSGRG